jgi:hypothetical protein
MANSAQTTAQLQHLRKASYALATTAPAISAHLMSRYLSLLPPDFNVDADRQTACFACGTIRTPGCLAPVQTVTTREDEKKKRKRDTSNGEGGKAGISSVSYTCTTCQRITVSLQSAFATRPTNFSPNTSQTANLPTEASAPATRSTKSAGQPPTPSSSSQSSRKRPKKSSSLSKMLAAQKQGTGGSSGGGFGLDLMDLLKTA